MGNDASRLLLHCFGCSCLLKSSPYRFFPPGQAAVFFFFLEAGKKEIRGAMSNGVGNAIYIFTMSTSAYSYLS